MSDSNLLDPHDPGAYEDYGVDWGTLLTADGEASLSTSAWSASTPTGLTVGSISATTTVGIAWVTGGAPGRTYGLTNRITTPAGRTWERTIFIPCKQL